MSTSPANVLEQPVVGKSVLVSFFDGTHKVRSTVAHVLSVSVTATDLTTEDGLPAISVAYPAEPIDTLKLSSPRWQDAFVRTSGVVHFSHPLAKAGKVSTVWGYPVQEGELPEMFQPEGDGQNPIFTREALPEPTQPDMAQVSAVQSGKAPDGASISPLTSEAGKPSAADLDAHAADQAAAQATTSPTTVEAPTGAHAEAEQKS